MSRVRREKRERESWPSYHGPGTAKVKDPVAERQAPPEARLERPAGQTTQNQAFPVQRAAARPLETAAARKTAQKERQQSESATPRGPVIRRSRALRRTWRTPWPSWTPLRHEGQSRTARSMPKRKHACAGCCGRERPIAIEWTWLRSGEASDGPVTSGTSLHCLSSSLGLTSTAEGAAARWRRRCRPGDSRRAHRRRRPRRRHAAGQTRTPRGTAPRQSRRRTRGRSWARWTRG